MEISIFFWIECDFSCLCERQNRRCENNCYCFFISTHQEEEGNYISFISERNIIKKLSLSLSSLSRFLLNINVYCHWLFHSSSPIHLWFSIFAIARTLCETREALREGGRRRDNLLKRNCFSQKQKLRADKQQENERHEKANGKKCPGRTLGGILFRFPSRLTVDCERLPEMTRRSENSGASSSLKQLSSVSLAWFIIWRDSDYAFATSLSHSGILRETWKLH